MASNKWSSLNVREETKNFIRHLGFKRMTPVQAVTIPNFLNNKDVAVEACTGSGKTLSFLIPMLEILARLYEKEEKEENEMSDDDSESVLEDVEEPAVKRRKKDPGILIKKKTKIRPHIRGVILAPTRELAQQINAVLENYLKFWASQIFRSLLIVGGSGAIENTDIIIVKQAGLMSETKIKSSETNDEKMAKNVIVVGTPGRVKHLQELCEKKGKLLFRNVEMLILDEADRLLALGFQEQVNYLLKNLPKQRRTGVFSATLSAAVEDLMRAGLRNPIQVKVKPIIQKVKEGEENDKICEKMVETPEELDTAFTVMNPMKKPKFLADLKR